MPRVGDVFQLLSGTLAVPNTTIQSAPYNAQQQDWVTEANSPRPVSAGGTGATTAATARSNLGAFGSADLASAATKATVVSTDSVVIIDSEAANINKRWLVSDIRTQFAPTLHDHLKLINTTADISYTLSGAAGAGTWDWNDKADGTGTNVMSLAENGNLTLLNKGDTGSPGPILFFTRDSPTPADADALGQIQFQARNAPEGSAGVIKTYADIYVRADDISAGTEDASVIIRAMQAGVLQSAITLTPTTTTISSNLTVSGTVGSGAVTSSGTVQSSGIFQAASTQAILATTGAGNIFLRPSGSGSTTGQLAVGTSGATMAGQLNAGVFNATSGGVLGGVGYRTREGYSGSFGSAYFNFLWDGTHLFGYADNTYLGYITFVSDYRVKKDVADLDSTWDTVKGLRPISYTHKDFTPPVQIERQKEKAREAGEPVKPFCVGDDIERWGFLAHELQETLVESAASGEKDMPDGLQSPDPWPVLAAVTKALQEAMDRIEELEARLEA